MPENDDAPTAAAQPGPQPTNQPEKISGPTKGHILSQVDQEEGLVHKAGESDEITDLGWDAKDLDDRLVPGLWNEDLFMLIRRFNKQIYYVQAITDAPLQKLDLNRAEDKELSPDKLRATLERFYTTIVVSLANFVNHVARLRSWREFGRTAVFCAVYFIAWLVDLLAPTFFGFLIVLVLYPPSRKKAFPPAPIALVDSETGGIQKPKAGVLGSHDSITGAPERMKGEAAEQEASNLMTSVASIAVGGIAGKHEQATPEDPPIESEVPDATDMVAETADAQIAAHGDVPHASHDKTRQPMRDTVLNGANQALSVLTDIVDTYERLGNALSPTPPFSATTPYLRIGSVLATALALSLVISSYALVKASTFGFGFGFFGDPILKRAIEFLNEKYPDWPKFIQLQNSLLKQIPTNAQLTLTLLRAGEANVAPLPPPYLYAKEKPHSQPASIHSSQINLAASKDEIHQAASLGTPPQQPKEYPDKEKPKTWISSMIGLFRGTTATGIESKLAVDRARAAAGSQHAKTRVGVLHRKGRKTSPAGPVQFDSRYNGKRGAVVIDQSQDPSVLYFTTDPTAQLDDQELRRAKGTVLFSIPVTEIQEMRKIGGLGWKGKLVAGWAVGSKEVVDGLVLVGKQPGQRYQLTAMKRRNELFNRLVAIDGQVWVFG